MKSLILVSLIIACALANSWEYEGGDIPFAKLGQEEGENDGEMTSKIYHYFQDAGDSFPILSVEYVQTSWGTFARSFKLHIGVFNKEFDGESKSYNEVEVSIITKVIIYLLDTEVVHVQAGAKPSDLVPYIEDERTEL